MIKTRLTVNILTKTLTIDGKPMRLEDTFTDAYVENADLEEPVLKLDYDVSESEDDTLFETEADKLREAYGEELLERVDISGGRAGERYTIAFEGRIESDIEKPTRKCYDILEPLESRDRRTTP